MIRLGALYSVLYVPTMMLTNSLAFHHLRDREAEFPLIRLWGTIGFVLPAWLVELVFLRGLEGPVLNERETNGSRGGRSSRHESGCLNASSEHGELVKGER